MHQGNEPIHHLVEQRCRLCWASFISHPGKANVWIWYCALSSLVQLDLPCLRNRCFWYHPRWSYFRLRRRVVHDWEQSPTLQKINGPRRLPLSRHLCAALDEETCRQILSVLLRGRESELFLLNGNTPLKLPFPFARSVCAAFIVFAYKDANINFGQDTYTFQKGKHKGLICRHGGIIFDYLFRAQPKFESTVDWKLDRY